MKVLTPFAEDLVKAWIANLRSGKFKQGTGALHPTEDTYCCLGVFCETVIEQKGVFPLRRSRNKYIFTNEDGQPESMSIHLGTIASVIDLSSNEQSILVSMNDANNFSARRLFNFNQIADKIEEIYFK